MDCATAIRQKTPLLRQAFAAFQERAPVGLRDRFSNFLASPLHGWLHDYALFRVLREHFENRSWTCWDPDLVHRKPEAIDHWSKRFADEVLFQKWVQFTFFHQWSTLKDYANQSGVSIIGDIPIYVSHDSSDVWANRDLFHLDDRGNPTVVAGVPPDYYSANGQLWGNPLFRWERSADTRHHWWIERVRSALRMVDIVRLDHFRGFEAYWEIPAGETTAIHGHWVKGPNDSLFVALEKALGRLPLIAEDLGIITPEVTALRRRFALPGMKILQFAFGDDSNNPYLPHNYESNYVVYTGCHDNDTSLGWFSGLDETTKRRVAQYCGSDDMPWTLIRQALASVADLAIVPAQDLVGLGSEARMNTPGTPTGNWSWRLDQGALVPELSNRLLSMSRLYGRAP